jgi:hypothetical protein
MCGIGTLLTGWHGQRGFSRIPPHDDNETPGRVQKPYLSLFGSDRVQKAVLI